MGTISSGVGLVSGINTAQIIDQLLALEARPQLFIQQQNTVLTSQQIAFQDINAKLLSLKLASSELADSRVFRATTTTSSNPAVLTAASGSSAIPANYSFIVDRLVGTQQLLTSGFADTDATAVAPGGTTLTFEFGRGRLDRDTDLTELNGANGVQRGKILITDRSGGSAEVDLGKALTVNDVVEAINGTSGIGVLASVDGDSLKLVDTTGSVSGSLSVADVGGRTTATDLGLTVAAVGDTLTGSAINTVGEDTALSLLNDGNGVRIANGVGVDDFEVTRRDGSTFRVDLTDAATLGDVVEKIAEADAGGGVIAAVNAAGTGIDLVDTSLGFGTFSIADLGTSKAATDLGIAQSDLDADAAINGGRVIATLNSKMLKSLNGGGGVTAGEIRITNRAGVATDIDLSSADSVAQVIDLINDAGAGVTASLNNAGNGLTIADDTGTDVSDLIIADLSGTTAADLGVAGTFSADSVDSGNLQARYVSEATLLSTLNGGKGVTKGNFKITDSDGTTATVDLSGGDEKTVADVLADINSRGLKINARVNDSGDGIVIEDTGGGLLAIKVEESGSSTARDLGLLGEAPEAGEDLVGTFEKTVEVEDGDTLDDVVAKINEAGVGVTASIINDGSSLKPFRLSLLSERSGKAGAFVFDDGGLGLTVSTLNKAQDAVVFFGSANPADGVAITSSTNSLDSVIPDTTIDLLSTSSSPVQVTISADDTRVVEGISDFVSRFNEVMNTINTLDSYNSETETRGLLLGDPTVARIRNALFRHINRRNTDLEGQFTTLGSVGITVTDGTKLSFDQSKFISALATDPEAVQQLFNLVEVEEVDPDGDLEDSSPPEKVVVAEGTFRKIDGLLDDLTDSVDGAIQSRMDSIEDQIELGNDRIEQIDRLIADKRARLEFEFLAMERAIAELQNQSNALASLSLLSFSQPSGGNAGR